jgi:adenine-specific DNA-methyltransferase
MNLGNWIKRALNSSINYKYQVSEINFNEFPITRYQGSKRKIIPWIYENIKDLQFQTALDGFGGSSTVSYLMKKMRKSVTYNDVMKFNHLIGKALIENQTIKFLPEDLLTLKQKNDYITYAQTIQEIYHGIYYKKKENELLDLVASNVTQMNHYVGQELEYKKAIAYYALFQSCLIKRPYNLFHRKNLNLRTAKVKRNFGNKTTWERPFETYLDKFIQEANSLIFDSSIACRSTNQSIFDLDETGYDLVYLDPPYLKKERSSEESNYYSYYHFLEGLCHYNEWESMIDYSKNHLPLDQSEVVNDFTTDNAIERFEEMLYKFRASTIVLSYKKGGIPSVEFLAKTMKKIKRNVRTSSIRYSYALNKQNGNAKFNREVLIIGI